MTQSRARLLVALVLVLASTPRLAGQSVLRLGVEFQVNSYTSSDQSYTALDLDADGDFVVTWSSSGQDGGLHGIFARRFNAAGLSQGLEFKVNTYTVGEQQRPVVALAPGGAFVVAWDSKEQDGVGGYGVFARRFDSSGVPQGAEFQVNTYTSSVQVLPAVAAGAAGDFVVAWASFGQDGAGAGIFARRFNTAGTGLAAEFQVNTYTSNDQIDPTLALDAAGGFVVVWTSSFQDGADKGLFARRFDSAGAAQAAEFQVNAVTLGAQSSPAVARAGDGKFLVAWAGGDGDSYGVFARLFDSAGVPQGADSLVNTFTTGFQLAPAVAVDGADRFVVAWQSSNQGAAGTSAPRLLPPPIAFGIFARRFGTAGAPLGTEFQVSSHISSVQQGAAIAIDNGGRFVVAWTSEGGQDGDGKGVFAQRFSNSAILDIDGNGEFTALTDGLLVLRFAFGFTGPTLTTGAVGARCTRCDATAIGAYLQTLI